MNAIPILRFVGATLLVAAGPACSAFDPAFGALVTGATEPDAGEDGAAGVSFARDIRPLMNRAPDDPTGRGCKYCHYSTASKHVGYDLGGLDLATLGSLRKGGTTSGAQIVVPGQPDASVIYQKLEGSYPFGARMPRSGDPYWNDAEVELVGTWIAEGAKGADSE